MAYPVNTSMAELATLVRNACGSPDAGPDAPSFELLTIASAHPQRALHRAAPRGVRVSNGPRQCRIINQEPS